MGDKGGRGGGEGGGEKMLLGKRPRPPRAIRRTTSITQFTPDVVLEDDEIMQVLPEDKSNEAQQWNLLLDPQRGMGMASQGEAVGPADLVEAKYQGNINMPPHPLGGRHRRNSADSEVVETAHFLTACGLCKRRLGPGRDTFMYRGDIAFCSLECRQQHINQDELRENCSLISIKNISTASASNGSEQSGDAEMVVAA